MLGKACQENSTRKSQINHLTIKNGSCIICTLKGELPMPDINVTFEVDSRLRDKFKAKADLEERTLSAQLRVLMEAFVENRIEIKD